MISERTDNVENNRVIAVALAAIAAMLVIMAGKGCTEGAIKSNSGKSSKTPVSPQYQAVYSTEAKKKKESSIIPYEEDEQPEETSEYIPVTEILTDENGEMYIAVVTEETPEPTTVQKSALEEYQEAKEENNRNKLSGYNHGEKKEKENPYENATIPSDFQIILD